MQSKSIAALKTGNDGQPFRKLMRQAFLDFCFHHMNDTRSNKNLAAAPVLFGFQRFFTILTA
jgi:hypothetical protein